MDLNGCIIVVSLQPLNAQDIIFVQVITAVQILMDMTGKQLVLLYMRPMSRLIHGLFGQVLQLMV